MKRALKLMLGAAALPGFELLIDSEQKHSPRRLEKQVPAGFLRGKNKDQGQYPFEIFTWGCIIGQPDGKTGGFCDRERNTDGQAPIDRTNAACGGRQRQSR